MLRLTSGEPVWDTQEDIIVMCGLATILDLLQERKAERLKSEKAPVQTSAAEHAAQYGHALRFGCCKTEDRRKLPLRTRAAARED